MNKRTLLSGLLIVSMLLGFTACKTSLLDDEDEDTKILFQAGVWEFTISGDGYIDIITCTIEEGESDIAPRSSCVLKNIVFNGETVSTLWAYTTQIEYLDNQKIQVKIEFHHGNKTSTVKTYSLEGTHKKTTASGAGTKHDMSLSRTDNVTFTARRI